MERKEVKMDFDSMLNVELDPSPPAAPTTKSIVKAFNDVIGIHFYLGGSRMMAKRAALDDFCEVQINIKSSTDFDYYVTDGPKVDNFLISLGFKLKTYSGDKSYMDDEAIAVYEIDTTPKVQVVLRKDADFYKNIFDSISLKFYYDHLWKSAPHHNAKSELEQKKIKDTMNQLFALARAFAPSKPASHPVPPEGPICRTSRFLG